MDAFGLNIELTSSHVMDAFWASKREIEIAREFGTYFVPFLIWMHLGKKTLALLRPMLWIHLGPIIELSLLRPMLWMHLDQCFLLTSSHFVMDSFGCQSSLSTSNLSSISLISPRLVVPPPSKKNVLSIVPSKFKCRLQSSFLLGVYQTEWKNWSTSSHVKYGCISTSEPTSSHVYGCILDRERFFSAALSFELCSILRSLTVPWPYSAGLLKVIRGLRVNDPSAGSPTETLLRLLLPLNDQIKFSSRLLKNHRVIQEQQSLKFIKPFNR